uniref:Phenylalanine--tRNA ligase beta subunit, chloroplastic n=1 Tax=Actinocyclus sp. (in: diatoms) TaxID=1923973 RepID=A0A9E8YA34_9STRA|nr:phenylalanine-tRNA ligase beta subunit [Actinocyclus sp. (in: diatoms)]
MRVSLNWLNQLVNIENVNLEHLIEKLTLGGFEVEEIIEVNIDGKKEIVIDISATANRADSLSIKGIAKEINSLMNIPQKNYKFVKPYQEKSFSPMEEIKDCSVFFAVTIENLNNYNAPHWLKQRLISVGISPVNNLLDYQNYILLETGFPFEFYDLEKIKEKVGTSKLDLTLGYPKNKTKFIGNNDVEYNLDKKTEVVKVGEEILSIAGILSNKNVSYELNTKSLLIEGAIYNSKKIRKTSRVLNIRTDRSARYEKGLNDYSFVQSFNRLLTLLKNLNPNLVCKLITVYKKSENIIPPITLKYENIVKILGPTKIKTTIQKNQIDHSEISYFLTQLNFKFNFNPKTLVWKIQVPSYRSEDITREIDVIEEIGRLYGFNNFIISLPKIHQIGWKDVSYQMRKKLTLCFLNEGLNELIHYSFVKENQKNPVKLLNPLSSDFKNLRTSLLPNIIQTVSDNIKQTNISIEGFEFGHVFSQNRISEYQEVEFVAGIFGGIPIKTKWSDKSKNLSWFEAKGKIEEIFLKLNLSVSWNILTSSVYDNIVHPYRSVELFLNNGISLGVFGQIHPIQAKKLNLSSELYLFEFNFDLLMVEMKKNKLPIYKNYSSYPKILKDLSFIVSCNFSFEDIKNTILSRGGVYLVNVELLDEYQGKLIPSFCTSLCVQLMFQSNEKTLTTKEIEDVMQDIELVLTEKFDAKIRI